MAYTTPPTHTAGTPLTAAQLNTRKDALEEVARVPLIDAYKTSDQTIAHNTNTLMTFQATYAARNLTLAGNAFTIVEGGRYLVSANFSWQNNSVGYRIINFHVNAVSQIEGHLYSGGGDIFRQHWVYQSGFSAGDVITIILNQSSGSTISIMTGSKLTITMTSR